MNLDEKSKFGLFFPKKWNFPKIPMILPKMGKNWWLQVCAYIDRKKFLIGAMWLKKYWQKAKDSRNLNLTILTSVIQQLWKRRLWYLKTSYFEGVYSDFQLFSHIQMRLCYTVSHMDFKSSKRRLGPILYVPVVFHNHKSASKQKGAFLVAPYESWKFLYFGSYRWISKK